MPFLVLYKELALLDSMFGLILIYALMVLPIVIWIMRDQFDGIPQELEQVALVDGCSTWGAFLKIILPIALPGMVAAFILAVILCWNEYFFAALLTSTKAKNLARNGGQPNRYTRHVMVVDGSDFIGGDLAADHNWDFLRALYHQRVNGRVGEINTNRPRKSRFLKDTQSELVIVQIRRPDLFKRRSELKAG